MMSTYAIGDIQGCFSTLQALLAKIHFDPKQDRLWFTGDLVNRGPQSLEVLRFIKDLGDQHDTVLGNHDLHLLAVAYGVGKSAQKDTLQAILAAPDRHELIEWLRHRPLLHGGDHHHYVLTHAGIAPQWSLTQAIALAKEVETVLRSDRPELFLRHMYGNQPDQWQETLQGPERWRCITNYFTRMRFCYADGRLELAYKGKREHAPQDLMPWFLVPDRRNADVDILFGHWAALGGVTDIPHVYALDTGCVWGHALTAMRLEDQQRFSVQRDPASP